MYIINLYLFHLSNFKITLYRPGYIAGVTNPAFEEHPQWWDVLFNINTGKVTISPNIDKAHPVENRLNLGNNDKESLTSSFDKEFMIDVCKIFINFLRIIFLSYIIIIVIK